MSFNRLAGAAGIVFVVFLVIGTLLQGSPPLPGDDMFEVRKYVGQDQQMHKVSILFGFGALPFALVFFAGVVTRLRESDRAHGEGWAVVAFGAAVLVGAAASVGHTLLATLFFQGAGGLRDTSLQVLWNGQWIAYASTGIAVATLTAAVAAASLRHGIWPRWHALVGLMAAVLGGLGLISTVSATSGGSVFGLIAFIGFMVWTLATSVLFVRERS